jgi:hypothetical protein
VLTGSTIGVVVLAGPQAASSMLINRPTLNSQSSFLF